MLDFSGISLIFFDNKPDKGYAKPGINVPLKESDPRDFDTYLGQDQVKRRIQLRLNALEKNNPNNNSVKLLLSAPAGTGKTAFARVVALEMAERKLIDHYFEIVAGKIEGKAQLDNFMRKLPPHSFVFIDEIHGLQGITRDAMLPVLQDNVFAFEDGDTMTPLPTGISWFGATTDVGKVHDAVQRRLSTVQLIPMEFENRAILAALQPIEVTEDAAAEMAHRCWTPWEIKDELYVVARDISTEQSEPVICHRHVLEACDVLGLDEHGLRGVERRVLETLYKSKKKVRGTYRYGMSSRALIASTGIDSPTFLNKIEPKLMELGFVTISAGVGRELTEHALEIYFHAKDNTEKT
jgi:Holliday junction resolvasome RuvABC ATP-dependent DNA helicase subunit